MGLGRLNKRRLLLLRWGGVSTVAVALAVVGIAAVQRQDRGAVPAVGVGVEGVTSVLTRAALMTEVSIRFEDVTEQVGVRFRHFPATRASLLPEDMGSGVAVGDYDGDGHPDLYFVDFAGSIRPGAAVGAERGRSRLYRNVGGERFEDVTDRAGVGLAGYGMSAAWGDYNNDGRLDLYVTAFGPNVLYENQGDGTFRDVTDLCGVQDARFSAGCAWGDYDRDGHIDLYVCNYVDFSFRESELGVVGRQYATEQPYTLNPASYPAQPNALFRNLGDGRFEEVAVSAGVSDPAGRSLAVSWADLDNDGWVDLYVANDVSDNALFRNRGDGGFEDLGAGAMAADYRGAMGLAVGDFDDDLDQDIFITHWIAQENALFRNMLRDSGVLSAPRGGARDDAGRRFVVPGGARLWFMDAAEELGLGQIALDMVGWATGWCDFDNDGCRDLWVVNGSTLEQRDRHELLVPQRAFIFWNRPSEGDGGAGREASFEFVDVAAASCPRLGEAFVGRGGAQVDFDGDGRVDLVLVAHGGEAMVLRNVSPRHTPIVGGAARAALARVARHWLGVDLRQTGGNTYALGARVYLTACGRTQMAEVGCSPSYLSQDALRLHFGLGECERVDSLRIVWPDGTEEVHRPADVDLDLRLTHHADAG